MRIIYIFCLATIVLVSDHIFAAFLIKEVLVWWKNMLIDRATISDNNRSSLRGTLSAVDESS